MVADITITRRSLRARHASAGRFHVRRFARDRVLAQYAALVAEVAGSALQPAPALRFASG